MSGSKHIQRTLWELQTELQKQFGQKALGLYNTFEKKAISTGFPMLDALLSDNGIPCGQITVLSGIPTSGVKTLAHKIAAAAQAKEGVAVYLDHSAVLDPDYAARCGVALERLLVAHPTDLLESLSAARDLVREGEPEILVFNIPSPLSQSADVLLRRFHETVIKSPTIALFLLPSTIPFAELHLHVERREWLYRERDVNGYRVEVTVLKDRGNASRRSTLLDITFDNTVQGDGA